MPNLVLLCLARHVRRCPVTSNFILLYRVSSCYTAVCLSCRTVMHRRFCANRLQRYCIFFIRARNLETFFVTKVSHPPPAPPLFHTPAASLPSPHSLLHHSRPSLPAAHPPLSHCNSAANPLFLRYNSAVNYGNYTAKRRQKDGNKTETTRNREPTSSGEKYMCSPPFRRHRNHHPPALQYLCLLPPHRTKTAFVCNFSRKRQ